MFFILIEVYVYIRLSSKLILSQIKIFLNLFKYGLLVVVAEEVCIFINILILFIEYLIVVSSCYNVVLFNEHVASASQIISSLKS